MSLAPPSWDDTEQEVAEVVTATLRRHVDLTVEELGLLIAIELKVRNLIREDGQ